METHFKFQKSKSSYLNLASNIQVTGGGGECVVGGSPGVFTDEPTLILNNPVTLDAYCI